MRRYARWTSKHAFRPISPLPLSFEFLSLLLCLGPFLVTRLSPRPFFHRALSSAIHDGLLSTSRSCLRSSVPVACFERCAPEAFFKGQRSPKAPDHNRCPPTDDNARSASTPTNLPSRGHNDVTLPTHIGNKSVHTDTKGESREISHIDKNESIPPMGRSPLYGAIVSMKPFSFP